MVILIVDDDGDFSELLEMDFTGKGCRVIAAANATEALEVLTYLKVDAIVTDMYMPGLSGLDLLRNVKQQQLATRVFLITGSASLLKVDPIIAQADGLFAKPDQLRTLVDQVTAYRH